MIPLITGSLSTLLALLMGGEELLVRVIVTIIAIVSAIICIVLFFEEIYFNRRYKINGHEYVDLGLPSGIKWATCNVGANKPEEYGKYFAWGETREKTEYSYDNCPTYGLSYSQLQSRGYIDSEGNLKPQYDAARSNWGGSWRLPTSVEMEELEENCIWSWTTQEGKKLYKVTGPNGNSIFLPAAGYAGYRNGTSLYGAGEHGHYWSSTPYPYDTPHGGYDAYRLYFFCSFKDVGWFCRNLGRSVRPVSE